MRHWLMKTEPEAFSIDDLRQQDVSPWEGVRNYQARNFLRDEIQTGDLVLIYHSNAKPSGIAGIGRVVRSGYPDDTAWDPSSKYFDPKSTPENPIWYRVDVQYVEKFTNFLSLETLKSEPSLEGLMVIRRGMRLSVQPVEKRHFEIIRKLGRLKSGPESKTISDLKNKLESE